MSELERDGADGGTGGGRYSDVTARIATLLNDAEATAEQIRADAEADAERMVREAEARGRARVEELTGVPEQLRDEADAYGRETRAGADEYAARTTAAADEQARELLAGAKRQAEAMRGDAEQLVREIEDAGRARHAELRAETRALEEGRDQVVAGLSRTLRSLGKTTAQLEQIVADAVPAATVPGLESERTAPRLGFLRRRAGESAGTVASAPVQANGVGDVLEDLRPSASAPRENGTKDLDEQAKELGIRGRSRMSRDELAQAVDALKEDA